MMREVLDFLSSGGFVMWPLAIGAVLLWYALGWRMVTLSRPNVVRLLRMPPSLETTWHVTAECTRHSAMIRTIVMVAPLAGLLGTVAGMIETFDALGDMTLFTQSGGIAGGIAQALISTQMGLAVAIPGLVAGRLLDRRAQNVLDQLQTPGGA